MKSADSTPESQRRELTSFVVGEQEFCVDILSVREIRGWSVPTPLPQTPSHMLGVINLRGIVLPVMDLAARFGLPATSPGKRSVIIVVQIGPRIIGLLVDAVSEILSVDQAEIQPVPEIGSDQTKSFVRGLISVEDRMISEIALERLMPELEEIAA